MLPLEALRSVTRCVVHGGCPDGRAAALILHAALPQLPVVEMTYGSPEHRDLEPSAVLFADFSPFVPPMSDPPTPEEKAARAARLRKWAEAGALIIDHHEPDLVEPFGNRGVWGDNAKAESGAWLAWTEVYVQASDWLFSEYNATNRIARLAAIRDTWQRDHADWDAACAVSEALRFVPLADLLAMAPKAFLAMAEPLGPVLLKKARAAAEDAAKNAVRLSVSGRSVAVVDYGRASDVADLVDADLVAGFDYIQEAGKPRLRVTLRSRKGVDCRAIAKRHGGGGHVPAAGFPLPVAWDPYSAIARALED